MTEAVATLAYVWHIVHNYYIVTWDSAEWHPMVVIIENSIFGQPQSLQNQQLVLVRLL